jgi:hypothetical protein
VHVGCAVRSNMVVSSQVGGGKGGCLLYIDSWTDKVNLLSQQEKVKCLLKLYKIGILLE